MDQLLFRTDDARCILQPSGNCSWRDSQGERSAPIDECCRALLIRKGSKTENLVVYVTPAQLGLRADTSIGGKPEDVATILMSILGQPGWKREAHAEAASAH